VLLAILAGLGVIQDTQTYSTKNVVSGIQDFIVCIEMFLAALAHHYAFEFKDDWLINLQPASAVSSHKYVKTHNKAPSFSSLLEAVNVTDVYLPNEATKLLRMDTDLYTPSEATRLLHKDTQADITQTMSSESAP